MVGSKSKIQLGPLENCKFCLMMDTPNVVHATKKKMYRYLWGVFQQCATHLVMAFIKA